MIFIDNKYTKWYYQIIARAQSRATTRKGAKIICGDVIEKHHIIPDCFFIARKRNGPAGWVDGNPDDPQNYVYITIREHLICHWLLTKMIDGNPRYQMANALNKMLFQHQPRGKREKITSRKFQLLREIVVKEGRIARSGENSPMFNKTHSLETREKMSRTRKGHIVLDSTKQLLKLTPKHSGPNYKLRGENNAMNKPGVKEKREQIFLEKYGVTGPSLVPYKCEYCGREGKGLGPLAKHLKKCIENPLNTNIGVKNE